jgi:hypothetical protein
MSSIWEMQRTIFALLGRKRNFILIKSKTERINGNCKNNLSDTNERLFR